MCYSRQKMYELITMLNDIAEEYLTHRYYIASITFPILHIDYRKNIKFTPKHEAQSAHFSGRHHILHSCALQDNENGIATNQFVYHLSDDTIHFLQ